MRSRVDCSTTKRVTRSRGGSDSSRTARVSVATACSSEGSRWTRWYSTTLARLSRASRGSSSCRSSTSRRGRDTTTLQWAARFLSRKACTRRRRRSGGMAWKPSMVSASTRRTRSQWEESRLRWRVSGPKETPRESCLRIAPGLRRSMGLLSRAGSKSCGRRRRRRGAGRKSGKLVCGPGARRGRGRKRPVLVVPDQPLVSQPGSRVPAGHHPEAPAGGASLQPGGGHQAEGVRGLGGQKGEGLGRRQAGQVGSFQEAAGAGGHQGAGLLPAHARQGRQDFGGRVVHVDPVGGGVDRQEVHQAPLKDGSPVPLPAGPAVEQLPAHPGDLQQLFHEAEGPPPGSGGSGPRAGSAPGHHRGGQGLGPGGARAHDPQQPLQGLGAGGVQVQLAGFVHEGQVAPHLPAAEPVVVHPPGIGEEGLLLPRVGVGVGHAVEHGFQRPAGKEVGLLGLARGPGQGGLGADGGRQGEGQQGEPHHDPQDGDEDHAAVDRWKGNCWQAVACLWSAICSRLCSSPIFRCPFRRFLSYIDIQDGQDEEPGDPVYPVYPCFFHDCRHRLQRSSPVDRVLAWGGTPL